jgi:hypothetical protein
MALDKIFGWVDSGKDALASNKAAVIQSLVRNPADDIVFNLILKK